jgi:hypothetical protein
MSQDLAAGVLCREIEPPDHVVHLIHDVWVRGELEGLDPIAPDR